MSYLSASYGPLEKKWRPDGDRRWSALLGYLFALCFIHIDKTRKKLLWMLTRRSKLMTPQSNALFINQIVALRQEEADETALDQYQAFTKLLSRLCNDLSRENDALSVFRTLQMLHQAQIVEVPFYSTFDFICLTDIQGFKLTSPPPTPKHVNARGARELFKVRFVDQFFAASVF